MTVIGRDIKLMKVLEGVNMPMQLWNVDVTFEASRASYVHFDNFFASKLRALLVQDYPRIHTLLLQLLRPKEYPTRLIVSHNWVDIIPYFVSIVFRVYGF